MCYRSVVTVCFGQFLCSFSEIKCYFSLEKNQNAFDGEAALADQKGDGIYFFFGGGIK